MWAGMLDAAAGQLAAFGAPGTAVANAIASVIALATEPLLAWLDLVATRFA